ncbi:hypothetical protein LJC15_02805 [Desulfovibrio sp. OttesenSCG-928-G11]|nr:hypothetical protein [Desulfovibrio sp. OttesenSCG-928-G11]
MAKGKRYQAITGLFDLSINSCTRWGEIVDVFNANRPFYRKELLEKFFNRDEQVVLSDLELYKEFLVHLLFKHADKVNELLFYLEDKKHPDINSIEDVQRIVLKIQFSDFLHEANFTGGTAKQQIERIQLLSLVSAVQSINDYTRAIEGNDSNLKAISLVRLMADMAQAHTIPDLAHTFELLGKDKPGRNPGFKDFIVQLFKDVLTYSPQKTFKQAWGEILNNPGQYKTHQESYHLKVVGDCLHYREDQPASDRDEYVKKDSVSRYFREAQEKKTQKTGHNN